MNTQPSSSYVRYRAGKGGIGELVLGGASYGSRGRGARMTYTTAMSQFGPIMTAATEHGVCWLGIHESVARLEAELRGDYPAAELRSDDGAMGDLATRLMAWIGGDANELFLP